MVTQLATVVRKCVRMRPSVVILRLFREFLLLQSRITIQLTEDNLKTNLVQPSLFEHFFIFFKSHYCRQVGLGIHIKLQVPDNTLVKPRYMFGKYYNASAVCQAYDIRNRQCKGQLPNKGTSGGVRRSVVGQCVERVCRRPRRARQLSSDLDDAASTVRGSA